MKSLHDLILENAEADIEDAFDDFEKEIEKTDIDAQEQEAIGLTLAGIALSGGEIVKLIGKFINFLSKITGFANISGDKLVKFGDKYHHKIVGAFEKVIKLAGVKDTTKAHKAAEILHMIVVAALLYKGVGGMAQKFAKGNYAGSLFKGALNAVKTEEIGVFIKKAFAAL